MKTKLALAILLLTLFFVFEKGIAQAPNWAWAKSAGGTLQDNGRSIATDTSGNIYVTGYFKSPSITFGSSTLINAGSWDIFTMKYDANGNAVWAKSAGGTDNDIGRRIAIDASGNVYVTGYFESSITFGSTTLTSAGWYDFFIVKYDSNGNVLWAKSAGAANDDWGYGIATDAAGNVYVTGEFGGPSITFGSITLTTINFHSDIFIVKYDGSGNVLWAKRDGGASYDRGQSITIDSIGNIYVTGLFADSSMFGSTNLTSAGGIDIFTVKYDSNGTVLWAKSAGGASYDYGYGIATDASGNVYVSGDFQSDSITFDSITLINASFFDYNDIYTVKYDSSGNVLWATSSGGADRDYEGGLTTDVSGNVYVTGSFSSDSITFGSTTLTNANVSGNDIFTVKYDGNGNVLWAKSTGGISIDIGNGVATDGSGNVYVMGYFGNSSITFGSNTLTCAGGYDVFVAKLDGTTGIAEQNPTSNLTLYPNPATNYITINTNSNKKQLITITDITGKIIFTTTTLSEKTIINTKDFQQGVYAVQVQAGDALQTRKVIVVR